MRNRKLGIIPTTLLERYRLSFDSRLGEQFELLHDNELSIDTFSFYTSVSAVFSSKIEGEDIDLDSYIRHKRFGAHFLPDYTRKIDDLYNAYTYAQNHLLTPDSLCRAHAQLTEHILQPTHLGRFRTSNMYVVSKDGSIEYVAASPEILKQEMQKFFADMETLLSASLSFHEVFFFASMLHLVLVKIHPFEDGNGRISRLAEKWFLAQKLGDKAWFIQSERNYYEKQKAYYDSIRKLGLEYDTLGYSEALPFLQMLPDALRLSSDKHT